MTPLARLCLASGIGLIGLASALRLPQPSDAHDRTYVVVADDTLSGIALRFHSNTRELMRLNGIVDPDRLQAGQVLTIPDDGDAGWRDPDRLAPLVPVDGSRVQPVTASLTAPGASYVVARGDTLGVLSARFGVPLATLAAANGISRPDLLRAGQRLLIPAPSTAEPSDASAPTGGAAQAMSTPVPATLATSAPSAGLTDGPSLGAPTASGTSVGAMLASEAAAYGIDPALVKAVAWQESGWQMVVARDGGIGVMQLMPATAAWVGPALLGRTIDPYNLADNIQAGVALLASYLRQYGGNVQLALAAYNEGPQNVARGIVPSTAQYIADVLSLRSGFAQ